MLIRHWSTFKKYLCVTGQEPKMWKLRRLRWKGDFAAVLLMTGGPLSSRFAFLFYHFIFVLFGATPGSVQGDS